MFEGKGKCIGFLFFNSLVSFHLGRQYMRESPTIFLFFVFLGFGSVRFFSILWLFWGSFVGDEKVSFLWMIDLSIV